MFKCLHIWCRHASSSNVIAVMLCAEAIFFHHSHNAIHRLIRTLLSVGQLLQVARRVQPAQNALQHLFCVLLDRSRAAQATRQAQQMQPHDRQHTPRSAPSPIAAKHISPSLQHERDIEAALAVADRATSDTLQPESEMGGPGADAPNLLADVAAEVERYHVAEATTNLAALMINHVLAQVWVLAYATHCHCRQEFCTMACLFSRWSRPVMDLMKYAYEICLSLRCSS